MKRVFKQVEEFCLESRDVAEYGGDGIYIKGSSPHYAPLSFLQKKMKDVSGPNDLLKKGFVFSSYNVGEDDPFVAWYIKQFDKKLSLHLRKKVAILYVPDHKTIFKAIEAIDKCYQILRDQQVIINNKNLPTQIGEWYAKSIFSLRQVGSTSQRGFDFFIGDKHIEVKVHWGDRSSPKGVKVRKSLIRLSDHLVIIYVARDFTIRDICFLDSSFVEKKFDGKGHIIFLKDKDIAPYFFSRSAKHFNKVVNKMALMKFASSAFAIKLDGRI